MFRRVLAALSGLLLLIITPAPVRADPPTTGTVIGVVLDRGRPAPGITVNLGLVMVQTTDRAGRFRFSDVNPSRYELYYRTPGGGMTQTSEFFDVEAGEVVRKTEAIGPHGALAGRILDNHGKPAGGAQVGSDFARTYISTVADAQGRFFLDYLPPRAYNVYAQRKPTGAPRQFVPRKTTEAEAVPVPIETDRVTRIEERLLPLGVIEGTFTGPDGPIGGAMVSGTLTAADGSFRMYTWPGDFRLYFETGEFREQHQWATGAMDEADATVFHLEEDQVFHHDERLLANGTIGGRLLDYTGTPVGPGTVELTDETYETTTATVDSEGYWSAAVFPGDYRLRFAYQNLRLSTDWAEPFRVLPGQRTTVPDQALPQPGDVEVGVTVDGEPAQTFCVGLKFEVAGIFDFRQCTDNGTVLFEGLNPTDYNSNVSIGSSSWSSWSGGVESVTVVAGRLTKTTLAVAKATS